MRFLGYLTIAVLLVAGLAACETADDPAMPDVVGKRLDVAKGDIKDAGFDGKPKIDSTGTFGVVDDSNWVVCAQEPAAGEALEGRPHLTVDRSCPDTDSEPTETSSAEATAPSAQPSEVNSSEPVDYVYEGPEYEVVTVDSNQSSAKLNQYWVLTKKFDYATDAYKDEVRLIVADVSRTEGSPNVIVQIVSLKEVALAEAASTYEDFIDERGMDYAINVVPKKGETHWIASYTGGFDYNRGKASEADSAYEIIWRPYATSEIEKWKPEIES